MVDSQIYLGDYLNGPDTDTLHWAEEQPVGFPEGIQELVGTRNKYLGQVGLSLCAEKRGIALGALTRRLSPLLWPVTYFSK